MKAPLHRLMTALVCVLALIAANDIHATEICPGRAITVVVPFPPDSSTGIEMRIVAESLGKRIKKDILLEHKVGGEGVLAAQSVANAPPDGCTLLDMTNGMIGLPVLRNADIIRPLEFTPISTIGKAPQVLVVNSKQSVNDIESLTAYAKSDPKPFQFATGGTSAKLATLLLGRAAGIKVQLIPHRGDAQILIELIAGRVPASFVIAPPFVAQRDNTNLRAIAVVDTDRGDFPTIPTITESKLRGVSEIVDLMPQRILVGPPRLPSHIAEYLSEHLRLALREPKVLSLFQKNSLRPAGSTPNETGAYIRWQHGLFVEIVKDKDLLALLQ